MGEFAYDCPCLPPAPAQALLRAHGLELAVFVDAFGRVLPADRIRPVAYVGWTEFGLEVLWDVTEPDPHVPWAGSIWEGDCLEVFAGFPLGEKQHLQFVIDRQFPAGAPPTVMAVDHTWRGRALAFACAGDRRGDDCTVHLSIPWDQFVARPQRGDTVGLQLIIRKRVSPTCLLQAASYPQPYTWGFPVCMCELTLVEQASPPVTGMVLTFERRRHMRRLLGAKLPVWVPVAEGEPGRETVIAGEPSAAPRLVETPTEPGSVCPPARTPRATWLRDAGWGVCMHFLAPMDLPPAEWNERVDAFDVRGLAAQLADCGAGYFLLTVGQGSGHYCAPNPVYDELVGTPGLCSDRDLMQAMATALAPHGIRFCAYAPADGSWGHAQARARLGWEDNWTAGWLSRCKGLRLSEFQQRWERVLRYWSEQWGRAVQAWWIDGCHFYEQMYHAADEPNFHSFARALRAGNPTALVSFSEGTMPPLSNISDENDFTAGEVSGELPVCSGPTHRGVQTHMLSYLGEFWMKGQPRFSDGFVQEYTQEWISRGGAITWDVPHGETGLIPEAFMRQLRLLKRTRNG